MSAPKDRTPETSEEIAKELLSFQEMSLHSFEMFQQFIHQTMEHVSHITAPVAIYYGKRDDSLYEKSASFIYEKVSSYDKKIKAFPNSTHLMTLGKDQESLFEEVISFIK
ncbi:alpha/beta hydrolase [Ureibacillus sp. GCM10028918]|uniref:alpha/beta hydrolase n=1 Tax=Ureibacillus sp. GCM10028918 TaxID=3273429 RepID=UPI0036F3D663